ncbi:MAG TPA: hypothetical protein VHM19_11885, partial [Polyangiales bacterium]|nr:hypothetical protein [Polyangiales bacterium]
APSAGGEVIESSPPSAAKEINTVTADSVEVAQKAGQQLTLLVPSIREKAVSSAQGQSASV